MKLILGLILVFGSVATGFVMAHGNLMTLWQPYELLIIGGAASGAFVISNPAKVVIATVKGLPALLSGDKYKQTHYLDLLGLLYQLFSKARKDGLMAIENDVEEPEASEIFQRYTRIMKEHHVVTFICDYMRMIISGGTSPFELDNLMTLELETHEEESHAPAHALNRVADALPGFGIVAAVLGIVITMGMLDGDTAQIGQHVAAALVGTFIGILFAYGVVGPMSSALGHRATQEGKLLECAKAAILANLQGYSPKVAIEFGRKTMFTHLRPTFNELEEHVRGS